MTYMAISKVQQLRNNGKTNSKKPKEISRKKLIKKIDNMCSLAIRKIDNNIPWDDCEGVVCNNHLITRSCHKTRWHPLNCFCGSTGANYRHEQNPVYMITWFIKKYGLSVYEQLAKMSIGEAKWTKEELGQIYNFYKMIFECIFMPTRREVTELYNKNFPRHGVIKFDGTF